MPKNDLDYAAFTRYTIRVMSVYFVKEIEIIHGHECPKSLHDVRSDRGP
jgi:hypothetical protein